MFESAKAVNKVAKTNFRTVDEYIAAQPMAAQTKLQRVRATIHKALPEAEETISYQMPAYKQRGKIVLYFAGWKEHYSLYPAGQRFVDVFGDELALCTLSKGTLRFSLSEPVPVRLIKQIAQFRAKEAAERASSRPTNKTNT